MFGALAKCVKNLNVKEDPTLVMDVMAELKKVDGECVPPHLGVGASATLACGGPRPMSVRGFGNDAVVFDLRRCTPHATATLAPCYHLVCFLDSLQPALF